MMGVRFTSQLALTILTVSILLMPTHLLAHTGVNIEYSVNFEVEDLPGGLKKVLVSNPWQGARRNFCYLLRKRHGGTSRILTTQGDGTCEVVDVPVRRMVVLSSTYYAMIAALSGTKYMVGASRPERSSTRSIRLGYEKGRIKDVGEGLSVNVETILDLQPEVIFTYATGGFRDVHPKLAEAGLKVVVCAEYMEEHPLGRAEWIKFFGLFLGRYQQATAIFNSIKGRYLRLKALASRARTRPTVVTNVPFGGSWFIPGGKSFMAQFMRDANAQYIFGHTRTAGSTPMAIELVFEKGRNASFWLNTGTCRSLAEVRRQDPRLAEFKAFREHRVYNNNRRVNQYGGNDYWETGVITPDKILKDLVYIFHPDLIRDHTLYYYRKLQ